MRKRRWMAGIMLACALAIGITAFVTLNNIDPRKPPASLVLPPVLLPERPQKHNEALPHHIYHEETPAPPKRVQTAASLGRHAN